MKRTLNYFGLWSLLLVILISCEKDDEVTPAEPVASFQYAAGETNFLEVTFSNFSQNYSSSAWDFGDGATSTNQNPVHSYAESGTYTVTLTVESTSGASASKTEDVVISDPNEQLTLLAGIDSKKWKLVREGTSMLLASDPNYTQVYWAGLENNGSRPCYYDDVFTFTRDGQYTYDDAGTFWAEYGVFNNEASGCSSNVTAESCFEAIAANMINACGDDVSAWLSGSYSYTFDPSAGKVTLTGDGAWIGIPKLGTSGETIVPASEVTFDVELVDGGTTGVDTMHVSFAYDGAFWPITYVSYSDPALEPAVVTVAPTFGEDLADITPSVLSHTFETANSFVELQTIGGASIITPGADDPTDAAATKVGHYERIATDYQEAQLRVGVDSVFKDVDFTNLTKISIDVYLPSTNDYANGLTKKVIIGFGDVSATEQWWTGLIQYESADLPLDTWTTVTFDLSTPSYSSTAGQTPFDRNDLDMVFIQIGGGAHSTTADFYVRNFVIN